MTGKIDGKPTKEFFVNMITRDINIQEAILDLLDNCIDGAANISPHDFRGLFINITVNSNELIIKDNCGGFSLDLATKYAFRFGRPAGRSNAGESIGRFGIGMKRALFKMGEHFIVESKTDNDHFLVNVDVSRWKEKTKIIYKDDQQDETEEVEDWSFDYKPVDEDESNLDEKGTFIKVTSLNPEVAKQFEDSNFLRSLQKDIENLLSFSIERGIKISLNETTISKKQIEFFENGIQSYSFTMENDGVNYKIFAGLGETGKPEKAGWYIYCNDRLVLEANRNEITGWGVGSHPKFNNDYAMFRGVLFLNSEETIKLPLTTTKKGIDTTSASYRLILPHIKDALWQVTSFLKKVKKLDDPKDYRISLQDSQTDKVSVIDLKNRVIDGKLEFRPPPIDLDKLVTKNDFVRISFGAKRNEADFLKQHIGANSYKSLGESLWNYYVKMERLFNE